MTKNILKYITVCLTLVLAMSFTICVKANTGVRVSGELNGKEVRVSVENSSGNTIKNVYIISDENNKYTSSLNGYKIGSLRSGESVSRTFGLRKLGNDVKVASLREGGYYRLNLRLALTILISFGFSIIVSAEVWSTYGIGAYGFKDWFILTTVPVFSFISCAALGILFQIYVVTGDINRSYVSEYGFYGVSLLAMLSSGITMVCWVGICVLAVRREREENEKRVKVLYMMSIILVILVINSVFIFSINKIDSRNSSSYIEILSGTNYCDKVSVDLGGYENVFYVKYNIAD